MTPFKKALEKKNNPFNMVFLPQKLVLQTATSGFDAVCIFVNDYANKEILERLKENGVSLIALRCAGFNNIDLKAAKQLDMPVLRVPAYSPYAVAGISTPFSLFVQILPLSFY